MNRQQEFETGKGQIIAQGYDGYDAVEAMRDLGDQNREEWHGGILTPRVRSSHIARTLNGFEFLTRVHAN